MGLNVKLCRIRKVWFDQLEKDLNVSTISDLSEDYKIIVKNFEGIRFLLKKYVTLENQRVIDEVFYPTDYIGHMIDFESFNRIKKDDLSKIKDWPISYLSETKVSQILSLLNQIDKNEFLETYNSKELNDYGIYPMIWHDDESSDKFYNKNDIKEGFEALVKLFIRAADNKNYILVFIV